MKSCPTCRRTYADETLNYCLDDGAPLEQMAGRHLDETLTLDANEPPPTEILDPMRAATVRPNKPATTVPQQSVRQTRNEYENLHAAPAPAPRNTASVVVLTVVATILLLALGGVGAWLLLRDKSGGSVSNRGETGGGTNNSNVANVGSDNTTVSTNSNLPITRPTVMPTATPTVTPLSTPKQPGTDLSAARAEVASALEGWRQTMTNPDVDAHMSYYADVLHTYYNATNTSVSRVRNNVARAFSSYSTFDVRITNLQIEVDPSGQSAVATFDKTFEFRNGEKRYAGSGLNKFWFEKINGRWLITGEKDLRTYY